MAQYGYFTTSQKKIRAKASRILKKKMPEGWRMRLSFKRAVNPKLWRKGMPIVTGKYDKYWATATKYLGPTKSDKGYPYLKLFLYPNGDRVWSLSNWADPSTAPYASTQLALLAATEMDRVFQCLEALYSMCDSENNEMNFLIGVSKVKSLPDWADSFSPTKEDVASWTTTPSSPS
jgi:hypothetical protein